MNPAETIAVVALVVAVAAFVRFEMLLGTAAKLTGEAASLLAAVIAANKNADPK